MPIKFEPNYTLSSKIMNGLIRIEAAKQKILHLPLTPIVLRSLRETARLYTTHYSTMIEGNRLEPERQQIHNRWISALSGPERCTGHFAAVGNTECSRSRDWRSGLEGSSRRVPSTGREGNPQHRQPEFWRSGGNGGRSDLHRGDGRREDSRVREGFRARPLGISVAGWRLCDAERVHG